MGTVVKSKLNGAFVLAYKGRTVLKMFMVWGSGANLCKPFAMPTHMSACPGINEDMTRYCGFRIRKDSRSNTIHQEMIRTGPLPWMAPGGCCAQRQML
jgi:hypothetical protein